MCSCVGLYWRVGLLPDFNNAPAQLFGCQATRRPVVDSAIVVWGSMLLNPAKWMHWLDSARLMRCICSGMMFLGPNTVINSSHNNSPGKSSNRGMEEVRSVNPVRSDPGICFGYMEGGRLICPLWRVHKKPSVIWAKRWLFPLKVLKRGYSFLTTLLRRFVAQGPFDSSWVDQCCWSKWSISIGLIKWKPKPICFS